MRTIELSSGSLEYTDSGGRGAVMVFLHGFLAAGTLWDPVVDALSADYRCVVPTLPLGGHHTPMRRDADLSPAGVAALVAEFLQALDLGPAVLVGNDTGAVVAELLAIAAPERVSGLVITSSEAFDNFPPGLPGRLHQLSARMPGGMLMALWSLRVAWVRALPITFGRMAKRPLAPALVDGWLRPARTDRRIRRDMIKATRAVDRRVATELAARLPGFGGPALIAWASADRLMPLEHGRRLAALLPNSRLVEIADCYTLIPQDNPGALAAAIRQWLVGLGARATVGSSAESPHVI